MTRSLLWDAGPGEVRAGLIEDSTLTEFRIIRNKGQGPLLAAGEYYTARIIEHIGRGRAKIMIGSNQQAILEQSHDVAVGTVIAVKMTRAPIAEPGRWKLPQVRLAPEIPPQPDIGWHYSAEPKDRYLCQISAHIDAIICPDAMIANAVRAMLSDTNISVTINPATIAEANFDSLIDQAIYGEFPIKEGMLSIERTRAMTMIDIDGAGDPFRLNIAAAVEIPRLLRLLDIGGQIGVDFLAMKNRAQRQEIDAVLNNACQMLGRHECTAINGFGFAQILRPRPRPSVAEILCGTTLGRLSVESRAIALLRDAKRSVGHGPRQLVAYPAIIDQIGKWPDEVSALCACLGVAIELVPDASVSGYGYVHVNQL
jgi:ribonuclease G